MPTVHKSHASITTTYGMNELPANVRRFIKELENIGVTGIKDVIYNDTVPNLDSQPEDRDEPYIDVDIDVEMDSEEAAKKPRNFDSQLKSSANQLGNYFGIDSVYIYFKHTNKEEFAKKFLKQLKAYLKTTEVGNKIHSIGFNMKSSSGSELRITKKVNSWSLSSSGIRDIIDNYLISKGYPNVKIYIVN